MEIKRRANSSFIRVLNEDQVRVLVRKVSYSGMELVRVSEGGPWVPLHTLPLFREEATGGRATKDTGVLARNRADAFNRFIGFMAMAGVMATITGVVGAATQSTGATALLGTASGAMLLGGWISGMMLAVKHGARNMGRPSARASSTQETDALGKSLAALEAAVAAAPVDVRATVDIADVREGVAAARRKRTLLAAIHQSEDPRPGLLADLATARAALGNTTDVSAKDAYEDEIRSIEGLLESMDRAAKAASESEARERALLHELDALRLSITAANAGGTALNELTDRLASVRRQLQEEASIERDLTNDLSGAARRALGPQKA